VLLRGSDTGIDGRKFAFDQRHAVLQLLLLDRVQAAIFLFRSGIETAFDDKRCGRGGRFGRG